MQVSTFCVQALFRLIRVEFSHLFHSNSSNVFTLYSSCLQLRCNPFNTNRRVVYAVLPKISTDLSTLEVGFSMASTVCDSSVLFSLGYVTDTVFETGDFVAVDSFRNHDLWLIRVEFSHLFH